MTTARDHSILRTVPLMLTVALLCPLAYGKVIYVDADGPADFDNIQAGIDAASDGDTVLVALGEYVITVPISFRGKAITVISEAGRDETTIRMGTPADPKRASVVVFENNETDASVLDGFTITGGRGSWVPSESTWAGGGIVFDASSGIVRNCAIVQNTVEGSGAGVFCAYPCSPILIDCIIAENSAMVSGGGVFPWSEASLTMTDCTITENLARGDAGGGAICGTNSSLTMTGCTISENYTARHGAAVISWDSSSVTLSNCTITKNSSGSEEGAGFCGQNSSMTMTNCTITENSAASECGAVLCWQDASVTVTNSIVWGNTAPQGGEFRASNGGTITISYSNVAGGQAEVTIEGGTLNWGPGNIDADPYFAEAGYWADVNDPNITVESEDPDAVWIDGDYHLKSEAGRWDPYSQSWVQDDVTSPCIDRGDPNSAVGDEPDPNGGRINMGAYGGTKEASMSIGQPPPLPPLAHWRLDEAEGDIAHDSGYYGFHGILIGSPLWQPDGGQVDGALQLDGVDDYISTPFVLNPDGGPLSVFAWVMGGAPGQVVLSQQAGANWLMADPASGCLMTDLKHPGRGGSSLSSETVITDGDWHHVGLTWDGSRRTLYVDDMVVAEDPEGPLAGAMAGLHIGAASTPAVGSFWAGLIDDVKIYDRAVKP